MPTPKDNAARLRARTLVEIARTHFNNRRFEAALEGFDHAVAADPTHLRARAGRAHALRMLGRAAEALAAIDDVIKDWPDYAIAHSTRGSALQALGRLPEGQAAYERAAQLDPENPLVHYNFACFWALVGDAAKTREHLALAIKYDPRQNSTAAVDADFDRFRDEPWFQELVAFRR